MDPLDVKDDLSIPAGELRFSFERSSGPGGQHVNKVNTRAELRFDVRHSPTLDDQQRQRLLQTLGHRLNQEGEIAVRSDRFRSQMRNREDCREKLAELLRQGLRPPPPKRKPTRPSLAAKTRRRQSKKHKSNKKSLRRRPPIDG